MRALVCLACLWPGLAQAWLLGRWRGLALAILFALTLNAALITTFAWPGWPAWVAPGVTSTVAWVLVLSLWIVGVRAACRDWRRIAPPRSNDPRLDDCFKTAQTEYLKGHWIEAETLVHHLLARNPNDAEGRLLLASILRRTKRLTEATRALRELRECDTARRWHSELEFELEQLADLQTEPLQSATEMPRESSRAAA
jgi:hypothetical protein